MSAELITLVSIIIFLFGLASACLFLYLRAKKGTDYFLAENKQLRDQLAQKQKENLNLEKEKVSVTEQITSLKSRFQAVVDIDAEKLRIEKEILESRESQSELDERFAQQYEQKRVDAHQIEQRLTELRQELLLLEESGTMLSFGFYTPKYGFESSSRYQIELDRIRRVQKEMIANKTAAFCSTEWTVNGSRTEGRKQINQTIKLLLRAFNGECDAAISKVKYNNISVMEARINKAFEALNKLVSVQSSEISFTFLNAKLEELYLVHEYQEKLQEEKEEQRRIKEQMREEEIARREIEKLLQDSEREEARFAEALKKAREEVEKSVGEKQAKLLAQIELLEQKLAEIQAKKERAMSRAQMTRSGHVYIISNIGSFGENIYKIGMTRRLEPMDRVVELGDASVPFRFDVHAIIYCEDAPTLENQLHRKFHNRRINQVNFRKEFFQVSLDEISKAVRDLHGEIQFTLLAEAVEYRKTLAFLKENREPEPFQVDASFLDKDENILEL